MRTLFLAELFLGVVLRFGSIVFKSDLKSLCQSEKNAVEGLSATKI